MGPWVFHCAGPQWCFRPGSCYSDPISPQWCWWWTHGALPGFGTWRSNSATGTNPYQSYSLALSFSQRSHLGKNINVELYISWFLMLWGRGEAKDTTLRLFTEVLKGALGLHQTWGPFCGHYISSLIKKIKHMVHSLKNSKPWLS